MAAQHLETVCMWGGCLKMLILDTVRSLQMVIAAVKLKDTYSLEGKL